MKNKLINDFRGKNQPEVITEINKKQDEIFKARLEHKTGKLKDTSCLRRKSDELAVLKTLLKEKQLLSFSEFGKMTSDKKNQKLKRLFNAGRPYNHLKSELIEVALKPELWESFLNKII